MSRPFKNSHCRPTTLFACTRTTDQTCMQVMTGLATARVRSWSKTTLRALRHDWTRPVTHDRTHHRVHWPLRALCRTVSSVRRASGRVAEPASGRMQQAAFASRHFTGCVRSSRTQRPVTMTTRFFHFTRCILSLGQQSKHATTHTPSILLTVHAMFVYFYPSQSACNEREVERTQGSLSLFAMHVCFPPFTLAQFSSPFLSPLQMCQHHQVYTTI
jgi:hypothetical protein